MKRLIKSAVDSEIFNNAILYIKNYFKDLNLFKDPINESDATDLSKHSFNLLFNDNFKNLFIIQNIGRKFDEIINNVKNQYNVKLNISILNDNSGLYIDIENLDEVKETNL